MRRALTGLSDTVHDRLSRGPDIPRRLDKYLREATLSNRVAVQSALSSGEVRVNDAAATEADRLVFADDRVTLRGEHVLPMTDHVYIMLNKPVGVTSSARDPDGQADLGTFMARMPRGVFPIGRLDRMTSGLLLFTTDGDLSHAVLHPTHRTEKLYWLWLDGQIADDDPRLGRLTEGIAVPGCVARAIRVVVASRSADFTELHVTLSEGKNRQIRRMTRALGFRLHALHRKQVGALTLDDLPSGEFRELSTREVDALWLCTGGRAQVLSRKLAALTRMARACRAQGKPHTKLESWLEGANA